MSSRCREIQSLLADAGPTALQADESAQEHLVSCEECYALLQAMGELDAAFTALPAIDAPDAAVTRAVANARRPAEPAPATRRRSGPGRTSRWAAALRQPKWIATAATVCVVFVVSGRLLLTPEFRDASTESAWPLGGLTGSDESDPVVGNMESVRELPASEATEPPAADAAKPSSEDVELDDMRTGQLKALGYVSDAPELRGPEEAKRKAGLAGEADAQYASRDLLAKLDYYSTQSRNQRLNEAFGYRSDAGVPSEADAERRRLTEPGTGGKIRRFIDVGRLTREGSGSRDKNEPARAPVQLSPAQRFQQQRRSLEQLAFQTPRGYWANTYVPGDPVVRWLEARLAQQSPAALQAQSATPLVLEAAARQNDLLFDPPDHAAMAVVLNADRNGLDGEGRVLVQVGLRGTERHRGLRPPMNVGVVLDLRGAVSPETERSARALVDAFRSARDVGDRFSLTVAGRPGATVVEAEGFRHGPLSVALDEVFGDDLPKAGAPVLGLEEAVAAAIEDVRRGDDPASQLGSSVVVLVTAGPLGDAAAPLIALAQDSAVAGVPISVVAIGEQIQLEEIERLVLAGQGNRRLMGAPGDAERLVRSELTSLSRVIARALRLRIRLAPGVKLVEVIGSEPLDAADAQNVRAAETSIDRRLARNLGIEADRGEDEDGIQIVIPAYHAGDASVVLLDVVAPGPGPIADVTVRYKDLVHLRNGVARANLTLPSGETEAGPLERNVVKNLLAVRLSEALKEAGRALLRGDDARAIAEVNGVRELLASFAAEESGFQNDSDVQRDIAMLGEYAALLEPGLLRLPEPRNYLADSLQLAGYHRTLPRLPLE